MRKKIAASYDFRALLLSYFPFELWKNNTSFPGSLFLSFPLQGKRDTNRVPCKRVKHDRRKFYFLFHDQHRDIFSQTFHVLPLFFSYTSNLQSVFKWRQGGHVGVLKQRKGDHLMSPTNPRELSSILMKTFFFVLIEKHAHWSHEWKYSICCFIFSILDY